MKRNSCAATLRKLEAKMPRVRLDLDTEEAHKLESFGIFMILSTLMIFMWWLGK